MESEYLYLCGMDTTKVEEVKGTSIDHYIKFVLHKRKEQKRLEKLNKSKGGREF